MKTSDLIEFFNILELQKLLENHFHLTGILSAILDTDGNIIMAVGWQDICTRFHRANPISCARCRESDTYINANLHNCTEGFLEYRCGNGLWDVAMPIMVEGKHMATFFTGQFFYDDEKPDRDWFANQAKALGFDIDNYLAALDRVPTLSRAKVQHILEYYRSLVTMITDTALKNLKLQQDMLELARMEESLRESEATLRAVTESARDAIILIDSQGKITYWNPAAESILGWRQEEAIGQDLHLLLAPEAYHAAYYSGMSLFAYNGQGNAVGKTLELRALRKDGSEIPVELSLSAVQMGGHWHAVGIIRDISRRKANEQRLCLTTFMIDNISDDIEWVSPEGRLLDVNDACCRSLGYSREELLDMSVLDIDPTMPEDSWQSLWKQVKSTGHKRIESWHRAKDGRTFPVEINLNFLAYGDSEYVCAIVRDISERREAEEALQASEDRYRIFTAITSDYVFKCTRQGEDPYRIEWLAGPVKTITDYSQEEILALGCWRHIIHPDDSQRISARLMQFTPGRKDSVKYRIITKSGKVRWIREFSYCEEGRKPGELILYGSAQDITKQELLQEQLLKNQKLESLGVLAGGIAHDFNNILTGIMGNISFARLLIKASHRVAQPLEEAEKASLRAAELARQLLTFAKGGAPIKTRVDIRPLINECLSLVLRGTNVLSTVNFPENLEAIEADEGQLGQVFNNIIINAVQAMPKGGSLTVCAENLTLSTGNSLGLPADTYVKISFTDQGCGISDENLKKVFDPYYTTKAKGSGLGLTSAHSIISRHGGCIDVHSRVNEGTTFTFYLPAHACHSVASSDPPAPQSTAEKRSGAILVMDDEELIRTLTREMLEHHGYGVTTCNNGEEALALYSAAMQSGQPFLAAILDLTIRGGMGGKETAEKILARDPKARLIVSSGYANDPVMAEFRKYGIQGTLVKPYNAQELMEVLS